MAILRMTFSRWCGVSFLAAVSTACGADAGDSSAGESRQPIQGGVPETGYPAVGMVQDPSGAFCTASLIAPSLVLTAAHCDGLGIQFYTETSPGQLVPHAIGRRWLHPWQQDLALLSLTSPITDISPLPVNLGAMPNAHDTCTGVGYGDHMEADGTTTWGRKRSCTEKIESIDPIWTTVSLVSGIADSGDSGGPLLCGGSIAAVVHGHSDGDWPDHTLESYATLDPVWVQNPLPALAFQPAGTIAEARNRDGRLEALSVRPDGSVVQSFEGTINGSWIPFSTFNWTVPASSLTIGNNNASGRLELVYIAPGGVASHRWQTGPSASWNWSAPAAFNVPTTVNAITVGTNFDGRLEVFFLGTDNFVYQAWQDNGTFDLRSSGETSFVDAVRMTTVPAGAKQIAATRAADGSLSLFYISSQDGIWSTTQAGAGRSFQPAVHLGFVPSFGFVKAKSLAIAKNFDSTLEVFYIPFSSNFIWHFRQTGATTWTNATALQSSAQVKSLGVAANADGRLEVFSIGLSDGLVRHQWQGTPGGSWSSVVSLADAHAKSFTLGANADGRLEMLFVGTDDGIYDIRQVTPNGGWSAIERRL